MAKIRNPIEQACVTHNLHCISVSHYPKHMKGQNYTCYLHPVPGECHSTWGGSMTEAIDNAIKEWKEKTYGQASNLGGENQSPEGERPADRPDHSAGTGEVSHDDAGGDQSPTPVLGDRPNDAVEPAS